MRTRLAPLAAGLLGAATLAAGACTAGPTTLPTPNCPAAPTTWTIGPASNPVVLNPGDYPAAPHSGTTSIDIQLSPPYLKEILRARLEAPPADNPNPDSGVFVDSVSLAQTGSGAQRLSLADVMVTPWLLGNNGVHARWTYSYTLRLKIVPYMVTTATVPDESKRRALLTSSDQGAVLRFDLQELRGHGEMIACSSPNFNLVDAKVLTSLYHALGHEEPLRLPTAALTSIAEKMLGVKTRLIGLDIGSDSGVKIGFLLDSGSPRTFDPFVTFGHLPSSDWGVMLDTSFVTAAVTAQINTQIGAIPSATVDAVSVAFQQGSTLGAGTIAVTVKGTLHKCGNIHFTSAVTVSVAILRRSDGTVVFGPMTQTTTNDANLPQGACIVLDQIFSSIANPLGSATGTVSQGGPCVNPLGDPVQFNASPNDVFYATAVDTDNVFFVAGRSTFMDGVLGPGAAGRAPVPNCP
jgi:hypothetical protein